MERTDYGLWIQRVSQRKVCCRVVVLEEHCCEFLGDGFVEVDSPGGSAPLATDVLVCVMLIRGKEGGARCTDCSE
jgi:hypothetical protein